jgi:hypothetical protein
MDKPVLCLERRDPAKRMLRFYTLGPYDGSRTGLSKGRLTAVVSAEPISEA